jgi:hypothetical protein
MKPSLKALLTTLAVALLAMAVLVPIAGASGSTPGGMMGSPSPWPTMMGTLTPTPSPSPTGNTWGDSWCGGGMWGGSGSWGGTGMWGTGTGASWLTNNPDALAAWLQLKADHVAAMQTWYDTYKADLTTPEAQQALHDLWTKNWNDMKTFYEQYGNGATWTCPAAGMWGGWQGGMMGGSWDPSHMWGSGYGASWMTGHRSGFRQWIALRARQTAAVTAWQQSYAGNLTGSAAQTALQSMRTHMRTQVKSFYRNHGMTATTTRMRYGAGGWMGLGGTWGGWGW